MRLTVLFFSVVFFGPLLGASESPWQPLPTHALSGRGEAPIEPRRFDAWQVDTAELETLLAKCPEETAAAGQRMLLPTPEGLRYFSLFRAPIMAPRLAQRYPEINTYLALGEDGARGRLDLTPHGFHGMVRTGRGTFYLDPWLPGQRDVVICYRKDDLERRSLFHCDAEDAPEASKRVEQLTPIEGELRTYRIAVAATGEYTAYHGGMVADGLAAIVTALNRVNQIYELDLAVRMELIADNDQIVYTDGANDPYTSGGAGTLLAENQLNLDMVIGNAEYDIGHVFDHANGGTATIGVVCVDGFKARGMTGLEEPIGDPFYVDYVAHEMGHQWGANHTFNSYAGACSPSSRTTSTAYEPGSGSTIMAYAGLCFINNLQLNSDPYFHGVSIDQIFAYSRTGGAAACGTVTANANVAPVVEAGLPYAIPGQTPFTLTGMASDANDDGNLSYCWEEFDLGPVANANVDNGSSPIFRSWPPVSEPSRTFPRLSDLLADTTAVGEVLPMTDRSLTFRLTVRDNFPGAGGLAIDTTSLTVVSAAGPFALTYPAEDTVWVYDEMETITWDVAGTDQPPINCAFVDLELSLDGGLHFDHVLATNVPNTGMYTLEVPPLDTDQARIRISCADNIFFDLNQGVFQIDSLPCLTFWDQWRETVTAIPADTNGNGIVDVSDYLRCIYGP